MSEGTWLKFFLEIMIWWGDDKNDSSVKVEEDFHLCHIRQRTAIVERSVFAVDL